VRKLGVELGLRILGEVCKDYADLLRQADAIFIEELRRHDLYDKTSQAFMTAHWGGPAAIFYVTSPSFLNRGG
jgi:hypothetical protein